MVGETLMKCKISMIDFYVTDLIDFACLVVFGKCSKCLQIEQDKLDKD